MYKSCTICSSRSRWPVRKRLDTPSYVDEKRREMNQDKIFSYDMHHAVEPSDW
jgi:hypothetical protein